MCRPHSRRGIPAPRGDRESKAETPRGGRQVSRRDTGGTARTSRQRRGHGEEPEGRARRARGCPDETWSGEELRRDRGSGHYLSLGPYGTASGGRSGVRSGDPAQPTGVIFLTHVRRTHPPAPGRALARRGNLASELRRAERRRRLGSRCKRRHRSGDGCHSEPRRIVGPRRDCTPRLAVRGGGRVGSRRRRRR